MRLLVALVLAAALGSAAPAVAQEPLRVYASFPAGDDLVAAAGLALTDHGGLAGGRRVELRALDAGSARAVRRGRGRGVANARAAAADPAAIAYLGERNSAATRFSLPVTNAAGLLHVAPTNSYIGLNRALPPVTIAGTPEQTQPTGALTFGRILPADDGEAAALAFYLRALGVRRVAVLDDGEVYGTGLSRLLRERLRGVRAVWHGHVSSRPRAVRRTARRLRAVAADALVFAGVASDGAARLWPRLHRAHPRRLLVGASGLVAPAFLRALPRGAARRTYLTHPPLDPSAYPPAGRDVLERLAGQLGRPPDPEALFGYEAMAVVLDAIDRAADPARRDAVVAAYFATRDRASVLGAYSVDAFGDARLGTYGGYRVAGGRIAWDRVLEIGP